MANPAKKINFKIITPERTLFTEEVNQVTLHTSQGEITVLPGHIPVITTLKPGELRFVKDGQEVPIVILGGFAEITGDRVHVLADAAVKVEELMEERAAEAATQAQELRKQKTMDRQEYAALTAQIERELAKLKVARKYKKARK